MRRTVALAVLALCVGVAGAQSSEPLDTATLRGFREIHVGMTLEQAKEALRREPLFYYRGDPDVSIVPSTGQTLIEVEGRGFVERGWLQFRGERLEILIVALARELVSYYEVYSTLSRRYGPVQTLDPGAAVWDLGELRLSLEKPVVLKYVDVAGFEATLDESRVGRDWEMETRQAFLDSL